MTHPARVAIGLLIGIASTVAPIRHAAAVTPPGQVSWVSAGDSYSSGEGVSGNRGACAQSDLAYGPAAADLARAAGWQIGAEAFTACTGHLAEDLFKQRPGNRNAALWDWGLEQGAPDRVDLLTFSFGGNDIGFADLLIDCLPLPDSFANAVAGVVRGDQYDLSGCDTPEQEIEDRITALTDPPRRGCTGGRHPDRRVGGDPGYDCDLLIDDRGNADPGDDLRGSLVDFYVYLANEHLTDIGHIVVVGYPNLFAPTNEWPRWSPIACQGVTRGDTQRIGRLAARLDRAIVSAVRRANDTLGRDRIQFVPRSIVYRNGSHELCGTGEDWLNGISVSRGDGTFHTDTSFHPNAAGHAATAEALMNTLEPVRFEPPPGPVAATTASGQAVPGAVLATAEQIYRAAQAQDLTTLGTLAGAPDFTYTFGDPPGDPVPYWSDDPTGTTAEMVRVLEQSVATDGTYWWWPAEWLTDETYFGFRIGIDNGGTWRFAVAGD